MQSINPDPSTLGSILAGLPEEGPIVMVNLLRFKSVAVYDGQPAAYSGRDAYRQYSELASKKLAEIGAQVIYLGRAKGSLIAPPHESWDDVMLVKYPSVQAFKAMLASPDYKAATRHRTAALDDARLIASVPKLP